jgi:hypothetical protein
MGVQCYKDNDEEVPKDGGKVHVQEQCLEQVVVLWQDGYVQEEDM